MKKTAILTFASALSTLLLIGCSATTATPPSEHGAVKTEQTQESMHHTIEAAGKKAGWRMTEFRGNAMIAEKDGNVVTIKFDRSSFHTEPKNDELEDAIEDMLKH